MQRYHTKQRFTTEKRNVRSIHVIYIPGACKLVKFSSWRENDKSNLSITENRKFKGLLQQPIAPLGEGNLPACGVLYAPHLSFSSHHLYTPLMCESAITKKRRKREK